MLKRLARECLRGLVYARLALLPLSEASAARWADRMKRWPAIFAAKPFRRPVVVGDGITLQLGLIDVIERSLSVSGAWDEPVLAALRAELKPGSTFLDVGANIGYFSLRASRWVGAEGRVVSVEPCHPNLARLAAHAWENRAGNLLIASVAAGESAGVAAINFPTYNNAGAASLRAIPTLQGQAALQAPLDPLLAAHGIEPSVIKLDVEGFELEALKGLRQTLSRHRPVVLCEVTQRFLLELGQSAGQLLEFMESLGYETFCLADCGALRAGDRIRSRGTALPDEQFDVIFRPAAAVANHG
jgi:FkbM family methyltransferase